MNSIPSGQRRLPGMPSRSGAGFLIVVCLFSCVFLVVNSLLVRYYLWWALEPIATWMGQTATPRWLNGPRILQIIVFSLPMLLVFVEWALLDIIVDLISATEKSPTRPEPSKSTTPPSPPSDV